MPLTVNVPYGYVKDPENPKHWLVDPEAAAIVKRIFSMCMEGRGPPQIANQLWVDKVLTPTAYKSSKFDSGTPGVHWLHSQLQDLY